VMEKFRAQQAVRSSSDVLKTMSLGQGKYTMYF